jgi:nitrogen fixation protein FixH
MQASKQASKQASNQANKQASKQASKQAADLQQIDRGIVEPNAERVALPQVSAKHRPPVGACR